MIDHFRQLLLFPLCVLPSLALAEAPPVLPSGVLERFCIECHSDDVREGGIRLDAIVDAVKPSDGDTLAKVLEVVSGGEMPPQDADHPSPRQRASLVSWLRGQIPRLREAIRAQRPSANRRLTAEEYNFRMQDLFGVDSRFDDLLPADPISPSGYRNSSQLLGLTTLQLEAYLASARRAVDRYVRFGAAPDHSVRYHIELEDLFYSTKKRYETLKRAPQPISAEAFSRRSTEPASPAEYADPLGPALPGAHSEEEAFRAAIPKLNEHYVGLPQRLGIGEMVVRIRAAGTADRDGRFPRMRVQAGVSLGDGCSVDKRVLGETDVTAPLDAPGTYQFRIRLEDVPTKGPLDADESFDRLSVFDMDHVFISNISPDHRAIFDLGQGSYASPSAGTAATTDAIRKMEKSKVNFLHLDSVEIEMLPGVGGNNADYRWTFPRSDSSNNADEQERTANDALGRFMAEAFGRPIKPMELQIKLELYRRLRSHGFSFRKSLRETFAATLVSPSFLYLQTGASKHQDFEFMRPYQLASRLSHLIWLSSADEALKNRAANRSLLRRDVLREEAKRLLGDPRSRRFLESFCRQWLRLDKYDTVSVDREIHQSYDEDLAASSLRETLEYFVEVFESDASALDLLDCDYAMLNDRMARHYGIDGVHHGGFQRVRLGPDSVRGGLLTQSSLLTMNSDGVDSHPIRRGVWLLDRLLNDPPPPPPPQVPQIDEDAPDLRGLTLKQRIELHRQPSSCRGCHRRIDPWGTVFENFDAIGCWRDRIERRQSSNPARPIDASATLPGGQRIADTSELKRYLRSHQAEAFADALVHHMVTYTLGRAPDFGDQPELDLISRRFAETDYKLSELVLAIVESSLFLEPTESSVSHD